MGKGDLPRRGHGILSSTSILVMCQRRHVVIGLAAVLLGAACGGDSAGPTTTPTGSGGTGGTGGTPPTATPVTDLSATALSPSSIRVCVHVARRRQQLHRRTGRRRRGSFSVVTVLSAPAAAHPHLQRRQPQSDDALSLPRRLRRRKLHVGRLSGGERHDAHCARERHGGHHGATSRPVARSSPIRSTRSRDSFTSPTARRSRFNPARRSRATSTRSVRRCSSCAARVFRRSAPPTRRSCSRRRAPPARDSPAIGAASSSSATRTDNRSGLHCRSTAPAPTASAVVSGKNYQVLYSGGISPTDNSGTLSYVRVEFAGYCAVAGQRARLRSPSPRSAQARASRTCNRWPASTTRSDSSAGRSMAITSSRTRPATTCSTCPRASPAACSSSSATTRSRSRRAAARDRHRSDVQGIESDGCIGTGCDNGVQLGAAHDSTRREFHARRVRHTVVQRLGRRRRPHAAPRHRRLLRQRRSCAVPAAGISVRDHRDVHSARASASDPDLSLSDLPSATSTSSEVPNPLFQISHGRQPAVRLDLPNNGLTRGFAVTQSLFTTLPTPGVTPTDVAFARLDAAVERANRDRRNGDAPRADGHKGGTFVTGTTYLGAAAAGRHEVVGRLDRSTRATTRVGVKAASIAARM